MERTIHRSGLTEDTVRPSEGSQSGPHGKRIRIHDIPEHLQESKVASSASRYSDPILCEGSGRRIIIDTHIVEDISCISEKIYPPSAIVEYLSIVEDVSGPI